MPIILNIIASDCICLFHSCIEISSLILFLQVLTSAGHNYHRLAKISTQWVEGKIGTPETKFIFPLNLWNNVLNVWKIYGKPIHFPHFPTGTSRRGPPESPRGRGNNQDVRELKKYWQVCDQSQTGDGRWLAGEVHPESQAWE